MQLDINDLQHDRCWTQTFAWRHSALLLWFLTVLVRNSSPMTGETMFSHQNVKYIFVSFHGNQPYQCYYFSCSFISSVSPKKPPLCYPLECFPKKHTVLDTIDQSANDMHDFAGHVFRVGEIIACAPRGL